ncbi:5-(carboxyamino)imidazole ribonucleotide synthase [Stappia taiwanensis]|uniref:N5-carboxyaminoimidazole ribonucleotide synthase n=1 Tax=Stappia taiwanensis TaxID=992267 RepID=A0A838XQ39_9HYPH|nr:5-(carboxyamino)imidazole ribonucleotide synthase [Stappia taiwanensis]MBA4612322.1 5-(carboxyamino)imidazole ribonucleotide synthase [Stappia taiwanensis]GGF04502.1 N5-carboxyaminoimidazole ribonucleotide synthase [Stappia taiwanensis]
MTAPDASTILKPGATLGILGGGQLGRMLALAAAPLGLKVHVLCPDPDSPAFDVAAGFTVAAYDDTTALDTFAAAVDVVTYEFENVPGPTAAHLAARVPVRPGPNALAVSQDRLAEKTFLRENGIPVADFRAVDSQDEVLPALEALGGQGVLKTRRFGYDGKGQMMLRQSADATGAFQALGSAPAIMEAFVPFEREVSVIVARGLDGTLRAYDVAENHHEHHILKTSTVPATLTTDTAAEARQLAERIAEKLDYIGVLGVEMFVLPGTGDEAERLVVNEIAPRVHNSGHWTQDACQVSQFEQHVRAVAGWPLGSAERHADVVMENLIGAEVESWPALVAAPDACLHLYGKAESRPGRKMGHVNRLRPLRA